MNQKQSFTASGALEDGVFRLHRAGYVSEEFTLTPTISAANIKAAIEALGTVTTVTVSAGISDGTGTAEVEFTDPGDERLYIEKVSGGGWSTASTQAGQTLEGVLGAPQIDQIDFDSARLTPPAGGLPEGASSVNLLMRTKDVGAADSTYSEWATVIEGINFSGTTEFAHPANKICQVKFEIIAS